MSVSSKPPDVVRFGVFEADLRAGDLRKKGIRVKVQDLPFRTLELLLTRPNEIVTREDFRQKLWPQDVFVDFDRGISSSIKRLRDALGDSAENPIFIETVERRGYRWIAPILTSPGPDGPALVAETPNVAATAAPGAARGALPTSRFTAWKLIYALPVLTLIFVGWTLFPGFRSANAGSKTLRTASSASTPLHPANQEARDLFLQGRYYWNKRTPDDLHKAVDFFTQAIVHDPGYSDAYVGLADCYNLLREYSAMPAAESYPRALAAAKKAVELDDQSAQAHASLAFVSFWGAWDIATADREFLRAIELDPNYATAHHWYANCLGAMDRHREALVEIERAQTFDPTSRSILADKGNILYESGQRQEAIALLLQLEKSDPEFTSPHRYLRRIYFDMADYPAYFAEAKKEAVLTNNSATLIVVSAAEKGFAAGGAEGMFQSMLREQTKLYDEGKISPYVLATTYALEGNRLDAERYLKTAYDQHDEWVTHILTDHSFSSMRDDRTVQQITAGIFPQAARAN